MNFLNSCGTKWCEFIELTEYVALDMAEWRKT